MNKNTEKKEFHYKYYDLYTSDMTELRRDLTNIAERIRPGILSGPLYTWTHELAVNALKATYKKVYQATFLEPLGLQNIPYEKWLDLFKTEIEEHSAENFAHYCRENNLFVEITGYRTENIFRLEVSNDGVPTKEEWELIQIKLNRARGLTDLISLLEAEDDDADDEKRREGGGLGISLIAVGLRGLAFDSEGFQIVARDGKTISRIELPIPPVEEEVLGQKEVPFQIMDQNTIQETLSRIQKNNYYSIACFSPNGYLLSASEDLIQTMGYNPKEPKEIEEFQNALPEKFLNDIFSGSRSIHLTGRIDNYRISLPVRDNSERILFNISGHMGEDKVVSTLWQQVARGDNLKLSEGSFGINMQLYSLVEPYIPSLILHKAREVLNFGQKSIPDELVDRTIVFADLEGFTRQSEITEPAEILGLLNQVFSVMVQRIRKYNGHVEKFMGDAILATFGDPIDAIFASIEIQNQFFQLNQYRKAKSAILIRLRIGINSGMVLMGNIGSEETKDWTPLGDVVNTASRIEKNGRAGCIHLSESTYLRIKDRIITDGEYDIQAKGKKDSVKVYSVSAVRTTFEGKPAIKKLRKEEDLPVK